MLMKMLAKVNLSDSTVTVQSVHSDTPKTINRNTNTSGFAVIVPATNALQIII